MPTLTEKINVFTAKQRLPNDVTNAICYGIENNGSVRVPVSDILSEASMRDMLQCDDLDHYSGPLSLLQYTGNTNSKYTYGYWYRRISESTWQRADVQPEIVPIDQIVDGSMRVPTSNAVADAIKVAEGKIPTDYVKNNQIEDAINDGVINKVPTENAVFDFVNGKVGNAEYVPYSTNLDNVSDDKNLAWMNVNKASREFGHIYKREAFVLDKATNVYPYTSIQRYREINENATFDLDGISKPFIETDDEIMAYYTAVDSNGFRWTTMEEPAIDVAIYALGASIKKKIMAVSVQGDNYIVDTNYSLAKGLIIPKQKKALNLAWRMFKSLDGIYFNLEYGGYSDKGYGTLFSQNKEIVCSVQLGGKFVEYPKGSVFGDPEWKDVYHDFDPSELSKVAKSGSYNDLKDKPTINTNFVPYSDNLDGISDDLGVAWMNVSKESREFGHIYKRDGQEIVIPEDTYYYVTTEDYNKYDEWDIPTERKLYEFGTKELAPTKRFCKYNLTPYKLNTDGTRTLASEAWSDWATTTLRGNYLVIGSEEEATFKSLENYNTFHNPQVTIKSDTEIEIRHYNNLHNSNMMTIASYVKDFDYSVYSLGCGGFAYSVMNTEASPIYNPLFCERANEKAVEIFGDKFSTDYYAQTSLKAITEVGSLKRLETWEEEKIEGGWKDVYDTTTITADITAEVQRATTAEGALSTRIDTKADASTWSATLKQQIDTDHTTLSGLSAKWTDILFSQIDEDHTTLGTLNTYLSTEKRTSIDGAISKAHTQNTDTMLNNGTLKVESNKISATLPIVSSGDIEGVDTDNKHHLLSKKMDSAMLRTYNSFDAMVADKQQGKIPVGAWCAIIE